MGYYERPVVAADQAIGTTAADITGLTTALAAGTKYHFRALICYTNGAATNVHALRVKYSGTLGATSNGRSFFRVLGTNGVPGVWAAAYRSHSNDINAAIPTTTGGIGNLGGTAVISTVEVQGVICTNTAGSLSIEGISNAAGGFVVKAGSFLIIKGCP